jgi:hypothetical protein
MKINKALTKELHLLIDATASLEATCFAAAESVLADELPIRASKKF